MKDFLFILISISMTFLLSIAYFFNKGLQTNIDKRMKTFLNSLFGIIVFFIMIGNSIIFNKYFSSNKIFFSITGITIIIIGLFSSNESGISLSFAYSIYFLSTTNPTINVVEYVLTPILFFIILFFAIGIKTNKKNKLSTLTNTSIVYFIIFLVWTITKILFLSFSSVKNGLDFLLTWNWYLRFVIEYLILVFIVLQFNLVNNFYQHTLNLSEYSTFEYESFYRLSLVEKVIHEAIISRKISQGIMVTIRPHSNDEEQITPFLDEITNSVRIIDSKAIFFKTSPQDWSFFIQLDEEIQSIKYMNQGNWRETRNNKDPLNKIEKILKKSKNKSLNFSAASSLYGIQSNDFDTLIKKCDFMIMQQYFLNSKRNIIMLYDHRMFIETNNINNKVLSLNSIVDFSKINVNFSKIKLKNQVFSKPIISYKEDSIFSTKLNDQILELKNNNLYQTYKRKIALLVIEEYKRKKIKEKLFLNYSTDHMMEQFDYSYMENKIKSRGINIQNIIFSFDIQQDNLWHPKIVETLQEFKENGRHICVTNIDYNFNGQSIINNIKPNYLMFNLEDQTSEILISLK